MSAASAWLRKNWFVAGLAAAVALAFAVPGPGAPDGWMRPALTTKAAVALIFLFQGLSLNLAELRAGIASWRLHIYVEAFVFVAFPLIGLAADATVFRFLHTELRTGFLFLCVLPSTISTAVVYTSLAGGNTAGALFNSTVSNIAGVVITPLWIGAMISAGGGSLDLAPVIGSIASLVLVPLVIGLIVRPAVRAAAAKAVPLMRTTSSVLILFMVYTAFAGSVARGVWSGLGAGAIAGAVFGSIALFGVVLGLVWTTARPAGLGPADRIAALMCGPQKTLAAGVPMAQLIFAGHPGLGLILLPVLVGAWLSPRLRRD
jgi:sodium/bile acid cotransporter 7